jgi:hypothetical protein
MKPRARSTYGHLGVTLKRKDQEITMAVHRLVMLAFVGPCPDGLNVCHNDGVATNNVLGNLRYDTPSSNSQDRVRHGNDYNRRKTHCIHGHEFTPGNTYYRRNGRRLCRTCHIANVRSGKLRQMQENPERIREQNRLAQARHRARKRAAKEAAAATAENLAG